MSFRRTLLRACDPSVSPAVRRSAFRWCLGRFCSLSRRSFRETWGQFADWYSLDGAAGFSAENARRAVEALSAERYAFLARLHLFVRNRMAVKNPHRRPPGEAELQRLYRSDWVIAGVPDGREIEPRAYLTVQFGAVGCQLEKRDVRTQLWWYPVYGHRVFGPWTRAELISYFRLAYARSQPPHRWPFPIGQIEQFYESADTILKSHE